MRKHSRSNLEHEIVRVTQSCRVTESISQLHDARSSPEFSDPLLATIPIDISSKREEKHEQLNLTFQFLNIYDSASSTVTQNTVVECDLCGV